MLLKTHTPLFNAKKTGPKKTKTGLLKRRILIKAFNC